MNQAGSRSKQTIAIAAAWLLFSNAAASAEDEFFDVEPPSAKPSAPVEPPRPIRMEIHDDEFAPTKKSKFSMFKSSNESKKIAANESVKDVPPETDSSKPSMPKSVAGVMCGVLIGVPVRAAKTMASETKRMNAQVSKDLTWGFDNRKPDLGARAGAAILSVPYGVATGLITGVTKGTERAVQTGARKPLSKESMSLSDPELR